MDPLPFRRVDLIQTGATRRGTLEVLPVGKTKQQKVVTGDDAGVVQVFSVTKGEPNNVFKSLPGPQPITRITLGQGQGQGDKIFVASGQTIRGLTKKGKEFFRFNTNLADPVKTLQVKDLNIWTTGVYVYNQFQDCKDANFYNVNDVINDLVVTGTDEKPVLACQDRSIRVLKGSQLYYEAAVDGPVLCIKPFNSSKRTAEGQPGDEGKRRSGIEEILYGTANGTLGQMQLHSDVISRGWTLPAAKRAGGITSISCDVDYTGDGLNDIVIGRDDGNIEVYGFGQSGEPQLVYEKNIGESISTLQGGLVTSAASEDIVVQSFSGKVLALNTGGVHDSFGAVDTSAVAATAAAEDKRAKVLAAEILKLKEKVEKEREKFTKAAEGSTLIANNLEFRINSKFASSAEDAAYTLTLETQMPIDTVALQCDVPVDLLDLDTSMAILSRCRPDLENGSFCLATYRCQEGRNRVEIRIRTIEGQSGTLHAFVLPAVEPKTSQVCQYRIRPLSLHQRIQSLEEQMPLNELKITGGFSLAEAHTWIGFCLPEVPSRTPLEDSVSYNFINTFLGTVLTCTCKAGEAVFKSDNISTISILKEAITREATSRKVRINISFELNDASVPHFVQLVDPRLAYQLALSQKVDIIEALRELKMQEDDISFLAPTFLEVLQNAERIEAEYKLQPRCLELLHGILKDFYLDWHRFKGKAAKAGLPQLDALLLNYDPVTLLKFLQTSPKY